MIVYLITQHESEGAIFTGATFKPEIFSIKGDAEKRFNSLQKSRSPFSGVFYTLEEITVQGAA